jgi:hypothetical protein
VRPGLKFRIFESAVYIVVGVALMSLGVVQSVRDVWK